MAPAAAEKGGGRYLFGISPSRGPVGTVVTAASVTPCPTGTVEVVVAFDEWRDVGEDLLQVTAQLSEDGGWQSAFTVPTGASTGRYEVMASCRAGSGTPIVNYRNVFFRVTA